MIENYNNDDRERTFLIALDTGEYDAEVSMNELCELAKTAGSDVLGTSVQKRPVPEAATYVGKGMLQQISDFCKNNAVDLIIADGELSPVQIRNIEDITGVRVIDRTTLILDIFASRAISGEGKLQVELAQLKYSMPRLTGRGTSLSRLGGGIGTRGPGETKLETDRRHIRSRIQSLRQQLDKMEKRRNAVHVRRQKNGALCVAIVGYTNAGKSTLMNKLTNAGVLQEDMLFATLDPTARKLDLPDGRQVMLVDTVGLVRRLPHQLVDAFRSTLEEAVWADVILNVCDASSDECAEHIAVTENLLEELGCANKPIINVLNKCDRVDGVEDLDFFKDSVKISALTGDGIDALLDKICSALPQSRRCVTFNIPYDKISLISQLREHSTIISESYENDGVLIEADAEIFIINQLKNYIV